LRDLRLGRERALRRRRQDLARPVCDAALGEAASNAIENGDDARLVEGLDDVFERVHVETLVVQRGPAQRPTIHPAIAPNTTPVMRIGA
jgi:hypothetical protein